MKRKLVSLVVSLLIINSPLLALADHPPLPDPGTMPDSPFYFLKNWKEQIQLFFTFNAEKKAKQFLHLAEVRFAEYQKMMEKGKTEIAERTLSKYEKQLERALAISEDLKMRKEDVKDLKEMIDSATARHIEILEENLAMVPEAAKKGIERVLEAFQKVLKEEVKITLSQQNNSGESGVAVLTEVDGNTKISLELTGALQDVAQPAHIHSGSCPDVGGVQYPLNNVLNGKSETVVKASMADLADQLPLAINVHKSAAEANVYVACGNLSF